LKLLKWVQVVKYENILHCSSQFYNYKLAMSALYGFSHHKALSVVLFSMIVKQEQQDGWPVDGDSST
jgi:hypothetical protein